MLLGLVFQMLADPVVKRRFVCSDEALHALLRSYISGGAYREVGKALGMSDRTIRANIQRYEDTGRTVTTARGGGFMRWTLAYEEFLVAQLEENNTLPLRELRFRLEGQFGVDAKFCEKTIADKLDKTLLITRKVASNSPHRRNTPDTKQVRTLTFFFWVLCSVFNPPFGCFRPARSSSKSSRSSPGRTTARSS